MLEKIKELHCLRGRKDIPFAKRKRKELSEEILGWLGDLWEKKVGGFVVVKQRNPVLNRFSVAVYTEESYENYKKYNRGEPITQYQQDLEMIRNLK